MTPRRLRARVRVHLPLAVGQGDVDEATGVLESLLGAALGLLGLLLRLDFGSLRLDFACAGKGSVDFSHGCGWVTVCGGGKSRELELCAVVVMGGGGLRERWRRHDARARPRIDWKPSHSGPPRHPPGLVPDEAGCRLVHHAPAVKKQTVGRLGA